MENNKKSIYLGSGTVQLPNGRVVEVHDAWLTEEPVPAEPTKPVVVTGLLALPEMAWPADVKAFLDAYANPPKPVKAKKSHRTAQWKRETARVGGAQ